MKGWNVSIDGAHMGAASAATVGNNTVGYYVTCVGSSGTPNNAINEYAITTTRNHLVVTATFTDASQQVVLDTNI